MIRRLAGFLRGSVDALEERNFRLLWIGQTTSGLGDTLVYVALAFAVLALTGSAIDLGLVLAANALPRVILLLVGGVWADRLPRQLLMVGCDVVRALLQAALAILFLTGSAELWHLVVAAARNGAASAFFIPAANGLTPQVVSAPRLQQANALMNLSQSVTWVLGPTLSGIIVATGGPGWVFAIDAVSFAISTGSLLAMRIPAVAVPERRAFLDDLAHGWREVAAHSWFMAGLVVFALGNMASAAFPVLGPVVADRELGGASAWGLILTGGALGGLAGGAVALRWRPARPLVASFGIGPLMFIPLLLLIPPSPVWALALADFGAIFAVILGNTLWDTVVQQQVPQESLSRVNSYDWMVSLIFQPIAFAIVGPLAVAVGEAETLVLAFVVGTAANLAILAVPSVRDLRRRDVAPSVHPAPLP
ncbi:MAG: MFS transporter [Candidatus Limnocylindria bacterium]